MSERWYVAVWTCGYVPIAADGRWGKPDWFIGPYLSQHVACMTNLDLMGRFATRLFSMRDAIKAGMEGNIIEPGTRDEMLKRMGIE